MNFAQLKYNCFYLYTNRYTVNCIHQKNKFKECLKTSCPIFENYENIKHEYNKNILYK